MQNLVANVTSDRVLIANPLLWGPHMIGNPHVKADGNVIFV